jgi:hypothetical protein
MSLPQNPNVTVDIYRGFQIATPYPVQGQPAAVASVQGYLKHHLNAGRFGYQDPKVKWTHLLLLPPGTDIRSAYNSWTGPAEPTQNADTVVLRDCPIPGNCCAFYVVMVQRGGRGSGGDHLRVYLDRLQPRLGGCYAPGTQFSCGACVTEPAAWTLTLGSDYADDGCDHCTLLNNGVYTLNYLPSGQPTHGTEVSNGCYWQSDLFGPICSSMVYPGQVFWQLRYLTGITDVWELQLKAGIGTPLAFDAIAPANFNCVGPNTFVNPTWGPGSCASASSATLARAA